MDDEGLNLLTEKNSFQFGYILKDCDFGLINIPVSHINSHYLYHVNVIRKHLSKNDSRSLSKVNLPTKMQLINFLKKLINLAKNIIWTDKSKLTQQQAEKLLALL